MRSDIDPLSLEYSRRRMIGGINDVVVLNESAGVVEWGTVGGMGDVLFFGTGHTVLKDTCVVCLVVYHFLFLIIYL